MDRKALATAQDLNDVLRLVHENTIYECAVPPLFEQAEALDLIEWYYAGPAGRDWLVLTERGRAVLGLPPEPSFWAGVIALLGRLVPKRSVGIE